MAYILESNFSDKEYTLINKSSISKKNNLFTVVIGNNGTGKSRFLSHLIKEVYHTNFPQSTINFSYNDTNFSKIIAITSSPFDKFPMKNLFNRYSKIDRDIDNPFYKNLSLKDERGLIFGGYGQFYKIIDSLFNSSKKGKVELEKLEKTFLLLGYQPKLSLEYRIDNNRLIKHIREEQSYEHFVESLKKDPYGRRNPKYKNLLYKLEEDELLFYSVKKQLEKIEFYNFSNKLFFDLEIIDGIVYNSNIELFYEIEDLRTLGLMKINDLKLWKKDDDNEVSFKETSSGERALFLNILGIASEIKNNTLICIDEPEISLHPEWQEKYMNLLMNTFNDYIGCHFIIATHSPNIISDLHEDNCFILNMDENKLLKSKDYINRSSDYQLAQLFKVPGFRNEYINREAVNILTTISKNGKSTSVDVIRKAKTLIDLIPKMDKEDPIRELLLIINESLEKMKL